MKIMTRSLLGVLAALSVLAPLHPAHASIPGTRFSVRPDPGGSLSPGGDYFVVTSRPGTVEHEALELSNPSPRPVEVRLAGVDATTAQLGGVDYSPSTAETTAVGGWIDLHRSSLTIAPHGVATVPFEVAIPEDAPPGVSLAGIAVWTPRAGGAQKVEEGLDAAVEIQTRRVVAVQIELPGPARPALEISGVEAIPRPDGLYLQVTMRNDGHGFAAGTGRLELDLEGESFSTSFVLDKVVPGTSVWYPIRWRTQAPTDGSYPVTVEVDYGSGSAEWKGEVVVGETVREGLGDRGIEKRSTFPLAPVAAAAIAVAVAGAAVGIRRKSKKRRPPAPLPPAHDPAGDAIRGATRSGPPPPPPPPPSGRPERAGTHR